MGTQHKHNKHKLAAYLLYHGHSLYNVAWLAYASYIVSI